MSSIPDFLLGPVIIIVADIIVLALVGRLGSKSKGKGIKFQPFTGGQEPVAARGTYQSSLFVFAILFLIVEAFALLLAGSYFASAPFYPILFLAGGGAVLTFTIWWFLYVGGGEL